MNDKDTITLEERKFLIYVTPYLGFHNVDYEELM